VRHQIAAGLWVEDGTEVVEGRELIRLALSDREPGESGETIMLVDPDSYLPVQARGRMLTGEPFSQTYEYLPRTAANLALLQPAVPAGFAKVETFEGPIDELLCDDV
jgi:hypothetical protein